MLFILSSSFFWSFFIFALVTLECEVNLSFYEFKFLEIFKQLVIWFVVANSNNNSINIRARSLFIFPNITNILIFDCVISEIMDDFFAHDQFILWGFAPKEPFICWLFEIKCWAYANNCMIVKSGSWVSIGCIDF